jgi:hypothetical protein
MFCLRRTPGHRDRRGDTESTEKTVFSMRVLVAVLAGHGCALQDLCRKFSLHVLCASSVLSV